MLKALAYIILFTCALYKLVQFSQHIHTFQEVSDLLLEREVDKHISSVETEVSKYELATNIAISNSDNDLDKDDDICDVGKDF